MKPWHMTRGGCAGYGCDSLGDPLPGLGGCPGAPRGSSAYGPQRRSWARKGPEILAKFLGVKLSRFRWEPGKT